MNFSVGDLITMNEEATKKYSLTTEGAVGIIVSTPKNPKGDFKVKFLLELNSHHPILTSYLTSHRCDSVTWPIAGWYIKLLKTIPLEDKIITKIKELDCKWITKQKEKGKDYALLRL